MTARRKFIIAWLVLVVLPIITGWAILDYQRQFEVDINSGRARESPSLWGFEWAWVEQDTEFSRLLALSGSDQGPPRWRRYHTKARNLRINYRYGGIMSDVRGLMDCMRLHELSEPDQVRFALAARRCLQARDRFRIEVDFDNPMLELYTDDGALLERWPHASSGPPPSP
jgi:hypothetical protein